MAWSRSSTQRRCCVALALLAIAAAMPAIQATANTFGKNAPVSVGETYTAAYHYVTCVGDYIIEPSNTIEVAEAVKYYLGVAQSSGKTLKIRASRRKFHSTTNFACPQQPYAEVDKEAGPNVLTVGILHHKLVDVLAFDKKKLTMRVGAGMQINHLITAADEHDVSLVPGTLPAYAGLTVGGIIAGGGHGTGDQSWSNPCDVILDFTWVDGQGNIHVTPRATEEGLAICSGMGILGIITEVTFQFTAPTHTKLITRYLSDDANLVDDIEKMLKVTPHMLVFWRPDMKVYSAYMLKAVSTEVPATTDKMSLLPNYAGASPMASLFAVVQGDIFDDKFGDVSGMQRSFMCPTVGYNGAAQTWASKQDGTRVLYTVGKTNHMQASECDDNCAWNTPVFNGTAEDVHYAIEFSQFREWVDDFKQVIYKDLWETPFDKNKCLGPGYIWLRFGRNTTDYLTMSFNMTRPVYVQSTWLRSRATDGVYPMRYNYVQELLEHMTLCKYNGRPHWGKNWPRSFTHPKCNLRNKYPYFDKVLALQSKYDPMKIFEPHLFSKVVKREAYGFYPHCNLNKDCFCEEDIHCPKDFACVHSKALPQYKVCKPDYKLAKNARKTEALPENFVQKLIDFTEALPKFPAVEGLLKSGGD